MEINMNDGPAVTPAQALADKIWNQIGKQKRSGILVPLFSVFSNNSAGIGDIEDIKLLVDFCCATGNTILQFLPMNEVGPLFCPYDSISSFALEPMYMRLDIVDGAERATILPRINALKEAFASRKERVDYSIKGEKLKALRLAFDALGNAKNDEFLEYKQVNKYWLDDFALFCVLKKVHNGYPWWQWEQKYCQRDPAALNDIAVKHANEFNFYKWLQWQLYKQFIAVKSYAAQKGVLLKGDLPILVSRDSADVWAHPAYFKLDFAAGAPPDMYCAKGQRWGTPTYNWEKIFPTEACILLKSLPMRRIFMTSCVLTM